MTIKNKQKNPKKSETKIFIKNNNVIKRITNCTDVQTNTSVRCRRLNLTI